MDNFNRNLKKLEKAKFMIDFDYEMFADTQWNLSNIPNNIIDLLTNANEASSIGYLNARDDFEFCPESIPFEHGLNDTDCFEDLKNRFSPEMDESTGVIKLSDGIRVWGILQTEDKIANFMIILYDPKHSLWFTRKERNNACLFAPCDSVTCFRNSRN
jgi:hypothetical protein